MVVEGIVLMKKLILLFVLLLTSSLANAQTYAAKKSITTAVPAATTAVNLYLSGSNYHQLVWTVSGTVSACSVRVDSSSNGSTWNAGAIVSAQTCTSNGSAVVTTGIFNYARINVVTKTGSGTVTPVYYAYVNDPAVGGAIPHDILSAEHTDTVLAAVQVGDLIYGGFAPTKWKRLPKGTVGQVLTMVNIAGDHIPAWVAASGGAVTINDIGGATADATIPMGGYTLTFGGAMGAPGIVINTTGNFAGIGVGRAPDGRYDFDASYEGVINASGGYTQNNAATNGNCLVGNGIYFVDLPCPIPPGVVKLAPAVAQTIQPTADVTGLTVKAFQDAQTADIFKVMGESLTFLYVSGTGDHIHLESSTPPLSSIDINTQLDFVGKAVFYGLVNVPRLISSGGALNGGDFVVHANWGNGPATIGSITGTDQAFDYTITATGAAQGLNPTVILTYRDGTWTNAPIFNCNMNGGTGTVGFITTSSSATALTMTFIGTPVTTLTYRISCVGIGR